MASSISLLDASAFIAEFRVKPAARGFSFGSVMNFNKSAAWEFILDPGNPKAAIASMLSPPNGFAPRGGLEMGLGVGRRPPPGRIPATAFAGANSDKALASSGIDPERVF